MDTFEFDLSPKEQDGTIGIHKVNEFLTRLLATRMREQGMTKSKLASILGVQRSTISRMLRGNQNLTARTLGEICGALNYDFDLIERDISAVRSTNNWFTHVSSNSNSSQSAPSQFSISSSGENRAPRAKPIKTDVPRVSMSL